VLGFVTDEGDVEIHSMDCPRAQVLKAGYGPRIVATRWEAVEGKFLAHVHMEGIDRHGILQELTSMISNHLSIDIRKLNIEAKSEVFSADLWVRVTDVEAVTDLCEHIRTIEGVTSANRIQ
jgi:GTP pyrophosphokinase